MLICAASSALSISIQAPREGSDIIGSEDEMCLFISIHAPREGSDGNWRN